MSTFKVFTDTIKSKANPNKLSFAEIIGGLLGSFTKFVTFMLLFKMIFGF